MPHIQAVFKRSCFIVRLFLCLIASHTLVAQTPNELNEKARQYLARNETKTALPLLEAAAKAGHPEAQYNLAIMYQRGVEVPQNDSIANEWLLQSGQQGYVNAQFKIAYSFAAGRGIAQNDSLAFYWARQCALQNDPECMMNVVNCYHDGKGVAKNIDSMLRWGTHLGMLENPEDLTLSAAITSARLNLAMIYREGKLAAKNLHVSYLWWLLYNESKRDFSVLVQEENIKIIREMQETLTKQEQQRAVNAAQIMVGRPLKNIDRLLQVDL